MFRVVVKYINFDDQETTKTLRFNLTEMELADLDRKYDGKYQEKLVAALKNDSIENRNIRLYDIFKELMLVSYGKLNDAGDFIKSEEIKNSFEHSEEYSAFFLSLVEDKTTTKFQEFLLGIFPKRLSSKLKEEMDKAKLQQAPQNQNVNK